MFDPQWRIAGIFFRVDPYAPLLNSDGYGIEIEVEIRKFVSLTTST
jgi:hypothetical protein